MADLATRIAKYLARCPAAVSGEGGHNRTFRIACLLVNGYALTPEQAMPFFLAYNERCSPPWTEKELRHKLADAEKAVHRKPRGHLIDEDRRLTPEECARAIYLDPPQVDWSKAVYLE